MLPAVRGLRFLEELPWPALPGGYCDLERRHVSAAGAGLLDAPARQHGFGGIRSEQTHRPRTRGWSRACMLCAYKRGFQLLVLLGLTEAPLDIQRVSGVVGIYTSIGIQLRSYVLSSF